MTEVNFQNIHTGLDAATETKSSETTAYITDLLGELQTIARIGGLTSLSDDIETVLSRHVPAFNGLSKAV